MAPKPGFNPERRLEGNARRQRRSGPGTIYGQLTRGMRP